MLLISSALALISEAVKGERGCDSTCLAVAAAGEDVTCSVDMIGDEVVSVYGLVLNCVVFVDHPPAKRDSRGATYRCLREATPHTSD